MKEKVVELFLEKSERFAGWTQLVAVTEDGSEYIVAGDICGGVPQSSWHKIDDKAVPEGDVKI